ncbi:hypothetical protein O6P43_024402 [Quillaja saponaria]|uniref:Uncharacterized protein n=1 Tax=Quillaja saponaria TaxID=32244 RepID=A0AAD7PF44_QUISA|nr:hypothetical protein O6P43_024402 [Quillaja saponaria]
MAYCVSLLIAIFPAFFLASATGFSAGACPIDGDDPGDPSGVGAGEVGNEDGDDPGAGAVGGEGGGLVLDGPELIGLIVGPDVGGVDETGVTAGGGAVVVGVVLGGVAVLVGGAELLAGGIEIDDGGVEDDGGSEEAVGADDWGLTNR